MKEWTDLEVSMSGGGFLSAADGYSPAEHLQCYDMLGDPLSFAFPEPDLQVLPVSQQQHSPINLPFSMYGSPSFSPSSCSSSSSSQPCHPHYSYSPHFLEAPGNPTSEPQYVLPDQGPGMGALTLGRRMRLGQGGRVRVQDELCVVCGDKASGYHYNALTCEGCKGFFRRSITKKAVYRCKSGGSCEMDMYMRRKCQECRLRKCRAMGMLAECLLTEVQCQSKRLRKGVKARGGAEEQENPDSKKALSASLSREQKLMLDRMVEAHRQFRAQDNTLYRAGCEWACNDGFEGLSDGPSPYFHRFLQFAVTVPGFDLLDISDQSTLLSSCSLEVMFLVSAQQFSHNPTNPSAVSALQPFNISVSQYHWLKNVESKENYHNRTSLKSVAQEDFLGPVLNFFHSMTTLRVTEVEYALLTATALLCSDRASIQAASCVESMQELILDLLSRACGTQGRAPCGGPQRFGRLLGRMTELRTLRHNHLLLLEQQT